MTQIDIAIRLPEVRKRTGLSKTEVYRRVRMGEFPPPKRLSHKVSVWSSAAIDRWVLRLLDAESLELLG